jgi:hypothetical protein
VDGVLLGHVLSPPLVPKHQDRRPAGRIDLSRPELQVIDHADFASLPSALLVSFDELGA